MKNYVAGTNRDIVSFVTENSAVLDVGCADGGFGKLLKEEKNCSVFGIEKNAANAKKAGKILDKVFCIDAEKARPKIKEHTIDAIIFADVLEHLKEPEKILREYRVFLKTKGRVIVSVPNIANFFIRKDLLLGRFEYTKEGILDENHLRFFTLKTIKKTLHSAGFREIEIKATRNAFRNVLLQKSFDTIRLKKAYDNADYLLANAWKSLFAQQFVILAEKVD